MKNLNTEYYISQRTKLLKGFDKIAKRARKYLINHYEEDFAKVVIVETREKFDQIIPEIPYIGGKKNDYTIVMVIIGWIIPFFRVMRAYGKTTEEVITICCEVADDYMNSTPRFFLWLLGKLAFSKFFLKRRRKQADQSQKRQYPADFVYIFVEGDGKNFDWALEFSECAVNKFYEAQGVEELKPYCNFFDVTYSRYLGMGINANETIGNGCQTCKLQYKKGGETQVPEQLKGLIPNKK
jgi:hypothetical protein